MRRQILSILIADAFTGPLLRLTNRECALMNQYFSGFTSREASLAVFIRAPRWHMCSSYHIDGGLIRLVLLPESQYMALGLTLLTLSVR